MTKDQFELAYRRYCENEGHSYDQWDIEMAWRDYQDDPQQFDYLEEFK